jgi:hypothetical protein
MKSDKEIVHDLLEIWLDLLEDGLGGLPTPNEAEIFKRITDIIPKELTEKRLEKLRLELTEDKR